MSIKLIAVDMDGTFLSDQKTYNRERFMAQYQQMKNKASVLSSPAATSITSSSPFSLNWPMKSHLSLKTAVG